MKAKTLMIPTDVLISKLKVLLPRDAKVIGVYFDKLNDTKEIVLIVESDSYQEVPEGQRIPRIGEILRKALPEC